MNKCTIYTIREYVKVFSRVCGVDDLHSGFLLDPNWSLAASQDYARKVLYEQLPSHNQKILKVGVGFGPASVELTKYGHRVTAISSNEEEINYVKDIGIKDLFTLRHSSYEDEPKSENDLIIYHEPWHKIPEYILFGHGRDLLRKEGYIVILDKVSLNSTGCTYSSISKRKTYINQAQRAGYDLVEEKDYTSLVASYTHRIIEKLQQYRSKVNYEECNESQIIASLIDMYSLHKGLFNNDEIAYRFLCFKRSGVRSGAYIRPYRDGDKEKINELFQNVFQQDQNHIWDWKFCVRNSKPYAILAFREGKLIAQYTGLQRDFYIKGKKVSSVQVCDIMVDKGARGQRKLDGAFAGTAKTFIEMYMGKNKAFEFSYGFPSRRHLKLGIILGLYDEVCSFWSFGKTDLRSYKSFAWHIKPCTDWPLTKRWLSHLWKKMRDDFKHDALGSRDIDYMKWRYKDHPVYNYLFLILKIRTLPTPKAIAIVRRSEEHTSELQSH